MVKSRLCLRRINLSIYHLYWLYLAWSRTGKALHWTELAKIVAGMSQTRAGGSAPSKHPALYHLFTYLISFEIETKYRAVIVIEAFERSPEGVTVWRALWALQLWLQAEHGRQSGGFGAL